MRGKINSVSEISDILDEKTEMAQYSDETFSKRDDAPGISGEEGIRAFNVQEDIEKSYEKGLPEYLQQDLDAYKVGLRTKSSLLDCLWGELYGSINIAEINERSITPDHAAYLRNKYLW